MARVNSLGSSSLVPIGRDWFKLLNADLHPEYAMPAEPGVRMIGEVPVVHRTHLPLLRGLIGDRPDFVTDFPDGSIPIRLSTEHPAGWVSALRPYQLEAVAFARRRHGVIFADALGLGKTREALGAADLPLLIVCEKTAISSVWEDELDLLGWPYEVLEGLDPDPARLKASTDAGIKVWLVPYHVSPRWIPFFRGGLYGAAPAPHTVIVDEAHHCQDPRLEWVKGLKSVVPQRTILLTGTPERNRRRSLWSLLDLACPGSFGRWHDFRRAYCGATDGQYGLEDGEPTEGDTRRLALRLSEIVLKRTRAQVGITVPPLTRRIWEVEVERPDPKSFRIQPGEPQIAIDVRAREYLGEAKAKNLAPILSNLLVDWPRIVLWIWHESAARAAEQVAARLAPVDMILGGTPSPARREITRRWRDAPVSEPGILIASIGAASSAVAFTSAGCEVFVESSWAPLDMIQSEARVHRPGQRCESCLAVYLAVPQSLDARIARILMSKAAEAERLFGADGQGDQMLTLLRACDAAYRFTGEALLASVAETEDERTFMKRRAKGLLGEARA